MTTSPVMSITDELVAELEEEARGVFGHPGCGWFDAATLADYFVDAHYLSLVSPATILALLAERAELLRDAERYRWLRDRIENKGDMVIAKVSEWSIESWSGDDPDAAIDDAMQSEAKP